MNDESSHAAWYLTDIVSSYWKWSPGGQEVSWSDGAGLPLLARADCGRSNELAGDGLPPLGSILLLLAACRNNWQKAPSRRLLLAQVLDAEPNAPSLELLSKVCNGLDKVQALPTELRLSLEAKVELAVLVFADVPFRLSQDLSQAVLAALDRGEMGGPDSPNRADQFGHWLLRDLRAIVGGLQRVDAAALRLRMQTGLETLPEAAPVDAPPPTGTAWLAWLEQQPEFAGVARLARRLMAVVYIPRPLHAAEQLQIGGVTDIASRGPLDRLLLSELAHDDLTLAVRVAMNEALYLRRESPPKTPPRQRHVVLDCGLRNWGLPRVYGTAVALALAARQDKQIELVCHRAHGTELQPVALNTTDGLREHLAALDHRLHPGAALPALADLLAQDSEGEAILVTAADTIDDPEFQRAIEQGGLGSLYVAALARDGRLELSQYSRAGRKTLAKAQLPLDEILKPRPSSVKLHDPARGLLPAIFRADPFPLLLSVQTTQDNSWQIEDWGVVTLAGDGRLLRWAQSWCAAQQLATGLPRGKIQAVSLAGREQFPVCLVVGKLSPHGLLAVWLSRDGQNERRVPLNSSLEQVQRVLVDRTHAYLMFNGIVEAVHLSTGRVVARRQFKQLQIMNGLYCREAAADAGKLTWKWSRLSVADGNVALTQVAAVKASAEFARVFDVDGVEGPVVVTEFGDIITTATRETKRIHNAKGRPVTIETISRSGRRFLARIGADRWVVETLTGTCHPVHNLSLQFESASWQMHSAAYRHRFEAIGITPQGHLALRTPKNRLWPLSPPEMIWGPTTAIPDGFCALPFQAFEHDEISGFNLRRAVFADGSEALLDSRGLLHLRSSNPGVQEFTIVLSDGLSAGWCRDGRMWGGRYWLGDRSPTPTKEISTQVLEPFIERARWPGT